MIVKGMTDLPVKVHPDQMRVVRILLRPNAISGKPDLLLFFIHAFDLIKDENRAPNNQ